MSTRAYVVTLAVALLPRLTAAQQPTPTPTVQQTASTAPVAQAFRDYGKRAATNLIAAAEEMPAEKYSFKPTPAQMSFGDVVAHVAEGNDYFCSTIAGTKAPTRTKVSGTDAKATLVARLRETFQFCDQALASLDDSKLGEELPFFGGRTRSRAGIMTAKTGDWGDHYSQAAIYLRLNGLLPPTAKPKPAQ